MTKVHILQTCEYCNGEAYLFECRDVSPAGEFYDRYRPCPMCQGSGTQARWINLSTFAELLDRVVSFEPDYAELARQASASPLQANRDAAGM